MKLFVAVIAAASVLEQVLAQNSSSANARTTITSSSSSSRSASSASSVSSSSRVTPASSSASPQASLYVTASNVVQCSNAQISWGGGQKPYDLTVTLQGGTALAPIYNTYDQSRGLTIDIPAGRQVTVSITDANDDTATQQYYVGGSNDASCLSGTPSSMSSSSQPTTSSSTSTSSSSGSSTSPASSSTSNTSGSSQSSSTGTADASGSTSSADPVAFEAKKTNAGAIAGGVVGGLLALLAVLGGLLFLRRRRRLAAQQERPIYRRWSEGQVSTPYTYYAQRATDAEMTEK